ncbi:sensor protein LytS [Thalassobacillus devorans]|uniref:histidine kinase n=1 Tax=Thalassobacillus devorans TaxID=279813 RepID=A0ABQ1PQL0_9BACI|nr:sensor histidine kinase [Thalassobacillus devorans]NIK30330.1 two-component system sensor histidine kinase LytS [Thalassobacillus devorans]GGD01168.1 sensor protein LytS [Thalassobacillus devorans]
MFELLLPMLERLGIIVTVAFIITRFRFFRELMDKKAITLRQQAAAILFFGIFGIIGTYTGITFDAESTEFGRWATDLAETEAIANSRVIGIITAGLLGGYKIGIGAGLIAGLHRYSLGGFTALACGISAIIAGILSGFFHKKKKPLKLKTALIVGSLAETVQMGVILLISKPAPRAFALVEEIGVPMIVANGVGSALFLLIIRNVLNEEQRAGAVQAQKALQLAESTISYLRKGLNQHSAEQVCRIIYREVDVSAIAITNKEKILAHVGLADDHHQAYHRIQTEATRKVIERGEMIVAEHEAIHCNVKGCPLSTAVIAPLKKRNEVVGTLKFYVQSEKQVTNVMLELVQGLSALLSQQLEIADAEKARQLAKEAEVKALQAQINPHFLFNSLNVIVSLIRSEPDRARSLLIALSKFFRQNLGATTKSWTTLEEELKHVKAYLLIEETRFVDKLHVTYLVDPSALSVSIAPLTLQPLVENCVKHGLSDMDNDCEIMITISKSGKGTQIIIQDNGKGIDPALIGDLGGQKIDSDKGTGIGLYNVNRRLIQMYGHSSRLNISSEPGSGTRISFWLPEAGKEETS